MSRKDTPWSPPPPAKDATNIRRVGEGRPSSSYGIRPGSDPYGLRRLSGPVYTSWQSLRVTPPRLTWLHLRPTGPSLTAPNIRNGLTRKPSLCDLPLPPASRARDAAYVHAAGEGAFVLHGAWSKDLIPTDRCDCRGGGDRLAGVWPNPAPCGFASCRLVYPLQRLT